MNVDVLECKGKAIEITSSENPPLGVNGKKKGYIEVLEELWNGKGYGHLNLKSQNLRDQASRLEKLPKYAEKATNAIVRQPTYLKMQIRRHFIRIYIQLQFRPPGSKERQ